jgi:uncharacterized damage-inducible protein DinB
MELNPYAKFLDGRDPLDTIRDTPDTVRRLLERMPSEQLELQPPGKRWNAREIVCHLADCELVFSFRLKQTLAVDSPVLQPFDQEKWALRYGNLDAGSALRMFEACRRWNVLLLEATTLEERRRVATHPERGTMTLWTIVETMGGHDINHLLQLELLAG